MCYDKNISVSISINYDIAYINTLSARYYKDDSEILIEWLGNHS